MRTMEKALESNFWKYTLYLITHKRLFITILGVYLLTVPGATPNSIGIMLLFGNLAGFIFEIPSGYFADKLGHKNALIFSSFLLAISSLFFLIGENISLFILGSIVMNIGWAFHSGTASAFLHETLRALNRENEYAKISGKLRSIGFAVPILFIVFIPFLVSISYKLPFLIALIVDIIGILITLSFVKPSITPEEIKEISTTNFKKVIKEGYSLGFFKYGLFIAFISGLTLSISGFKDAYQSFIGIPVIYYGLFFGASRAIIALLLAFTGKIKESLSLHQFLFLKLILVLGLVFSLAFISVPWVVVVTLMLLSIIHWGLGEAENSYLLDIIKSSKFKATLLSSTSLIKTLLIAIVGYGMGVLIVATSYQSNFLYLGLSFSIFLILFYIYIVRQKSKSMSGTLFSPKIRKIVR